MEPLDEATVDELLVTLPGWTRDGAVLVRTVRRKGFRDAVAFVNAIADIADERNHHPDLCLTDYRLVTIRLTTHAAGGITTNDVELARAIDRLLPA